MFATGITFNYGHILPFPSGFALQLTTSCILTILPLRVCGWEVEPARGVIIDISSWNNCFERPERERERETTSYGRLTGLYARIGCGRSWISITRGGTTRRCGCESTTRRERDQTDAVSWFFLSFSVSRSFSRLSYMAAWAHKSIFSTFVSNSITILCTWTLQKIIMNWNFFCLFILLIIFSNRA